MKETGCKFLMSHLVVYFDTDAHLDSMALVCQTRFFLLGLQQT